MEPAADAEASELSMQSWKPSSWAVLAEAEPEPARISYPNLESEADPALWPNALVGSQGSPAAAEGEAELLSFMRRALGDLGEVERALARRHEDLLSRLQRCRATPTTSDGQGRPAQHNHAEPLHHHGHHPELSAGPKVAKAATTEAKATSLEAGPKVGRAQSLEAKASSSMSLEAKEDWNRLSGLAPAPLEVPWPMQTKLRPPSNKPMERMFSPAEMPQYESHGPHYSSHGPAHMQTVPEALSFSSAEPADNPTAATEARAAYIARRVHTKAILGQALTSDTMEEEAVPGRPMREVLSNVLDATSGGVICLFIVMMAVWTQYTGFDLARSLRQVEGFENSLPSDQVWPGAAQVFAVLEWVFGIFFAAELVIRIIFRIRLWQDKVWNGLDFLIVVAFVIERLDSSALEIGLPPSVLRMARFLRLMRLLKLVRHIQSVGALHLIVAAVSSSMTVLAWAVALLMMLMMFVGMVNANLLGEFIADTSNDAVARALVYQKWGSFVRAYVSMFEITMDSWGPQCWILMDNVGDHWGFFFIAWKCIVGFAVIEVITSVFIQHTFKVATENEDFMIQERHAAQESYLKHLDKLFARLDETGAGTVCRDDFVAALEEPRVRDWFDALEVDVSDVPKLFMLLDDGDGQISRDEFIVGLKKLKGVAQSIDMVHVVKDCQRIRKVLGDMKPREQRRSFSYLTEPVKSGTLNGHVGVHHGSPSLGFPSMSAASLSFMQSQ